MRKVIAAINMIIDGYCDHTAGIPDDEIHLHYADLLDHAGVILYGRKTFELMQYWQTVLENPTGVKSRDEFAASIDRVPKIVYSHTLKNTYWDSASIAKRSLEEEVSTLKKQEGKDIYVGSPGLIVQLTNLNLINEYQLCIHPVVIGTGLPLFKNLNEKSTFKLIKTKSFKVGAVILYYEPIKNHN
jgi:dihydrofolate reductase